MATLLEVRVLRCVSWYRYMYRYVGSTGGQEHKPGQRKRLYVAPASFVIVPRHHIFERVLNI